MGNLNKVTYTDHQTVITADSLNAIQDSIIQNTSYTTCSTAANTAAKTAALTNFVLTTGSAVKVKFTNTNTASNPTLNVNSTGAKAIMQYGTTVAGTTATDSWDAGAIVEFVYDGTNWVMQGRNTIDAVSKVNGGTFGGNVIVDRKNGTTSSVGDSYLIAGNNKASGTDGNSRGILMLYSEGTNTAAIYPTKLTANRFLYMPDASGTLALNKATYLTSGSDLNDLKNDGDTGWYGISTGITNSPVTWGSLLVISGGQGVSQIIFKANAIYTRMYTGSPLAWTNWFQYKPNNTYDDVSVTTGTTQYAGYYYADGSTPSSDVRAVSIYGSTSNRPAFVQMITAQTFRVYSPVASTTVTVRVIY